MEGFWHLTISWDTSPTDNISVKFQKLRQCIDVLSRYNSYTAAQITFIPFDNPEMY